MQIAAAGATLLGSYVPIARYLLTSVFGILFSVALVVALLATPVVRLLGIRLQVMDRPGIRKVHDRIVTRVGGLAILFAVLAGFAAMVLVKSPAGIRIRNDPQQWWVLLVGSLLVFAVGFLDDLRGILPRGKFLVQIVAALLLCAFDIRIESIQFTGNYGIEFGIYSWPVTVLWVVGVTNAINLIDGLDGLAGGISIIASAAIAIAAFALQGQVATSGLAVILAGSVLGFLFFNVHPARIYLGDGGSMLIGFLLAAMTVQIEGGQATLASLGIPALALGVPIFDTLYSMLRRFAERRSPFAADKGHIHHRLLERGFRPGQVVMLLCGMTLVTAGLSLLLLIDELQGVKALLVASFDVLLIVLMFRSVGHVRLRRTLDALMKVHEVGRDQKEAVRAFEDLQLHFREVRDFAAWWQLVCRAAESLDFVAISMRVPRRDHEDELLTWHWQGENPTDEEILTIHLPIRQRRKGSSLSAEIDVHSAGSMESAGQRFALFARLMDECSLANLGV